MPPNNNRRELAWRVFAKEFNSATTVIPGDEQYAPTYLLSPLGALINRVYLTGVLTECENAGTEQEPLWRGRVSDPTDVFYISAGQFQPKAARILSELEVPALVGISGKARTYSPDENTVYVSVRVEHVQPITQEIRDYWVVEACQSLQYRLSAIKEALKMDPPSMNELKALGYSNKISTGISEAISRFENIDTSPFDELLMNVLNELTYDTSMDVTVMKGAGPGQEFLKEVPNKDSQTKSTGTNGVESEEQEKIPESGSAHSFDVDDDMLSESKKIESKEANADSDQDNEVDPIIYEQLILEIINSLAEEKPEGVRHTDVQASAVEHGLNKDIIEECIGSLIDKGVIYEPSIGLFKTV
jgi:RPA family protein